MPEGGEIVDEVGAAEEGVGDWGDLLKAEDEDVGRCLWFGQGGEEMGCEDGGTDGLAAAVEGYDIGI